MKMFLSTSNGLYCLISGLKYCHMIVVHENGKTDKSQKFDAKRVISPFKMSSAQTPNKYLGDVSVLKDSCSSEFL